MGSGYSRDEVTREKMRFLQMSLEEKRTHYHDPYKTLDSIKRWNVYYHDDIFPRERQRNSHSLRSINDVINRKVSVCKHDITELEIDAIIHPAPISWYSTKGQVTKAILRKVGPFFQYECYFDGIGNRGEAKVTGGYKLPAKYVINTVPPRNQDRETLKQCYTSCLNAARDNGLKTLAFPCIGTQKKNPFPREVAAQVALEAVRDWMESNNQHIDRLIFCCYQTDDLVIYNWQLQAFFPVTQKRQSAVNYTGNSGPLQRSSSFMNQDRTDFIRNERRHFLTMGLQEKRAQYTVNHVTLEKVVNWDCYSTYATSTSAQGYRCIHCVDPSLNRKVAVWFGDLTELEIDAIINSAAQQGGHVNETILQNAGETYREECGLVGYGNPGEARIIGGYRLPAKYVINTFAPRGREEAIVSSCYQSCLNLAKEFNIRTMAFPCIATGKRFGLAHRTAANLALKCVREWLDVYHTHVDMIIFCVYSKEARSIYEELMFNYFPVT